MDDLFDVFEKPASSAKPKQPVVLPSTPAKAAGSAAKVSLMTPGGAGHISPEVFAEFRPQLVVQTSHTDGEKGCISEICYPPDWDEEKEAEKIVPPEKPAKTYPFTLDPFQQQAIACLEKHQSVLVSAHTSAGKTVMAEYAIAMSLRDVQRVVYTSPIKALSNQKYRELYEEFEDVGLMTGDITINPSASCLVMTTEILRNMLYRGSEVMREVKWVIFDEIHYMRDKSRGVVWEETLIMLPDSVRMVFLSATIPNASEFAQWVAKLHRQPVNVVYTEYRPTPLQHYIFPAGGDGLHLVLDAQGVFRENNFQQAMAKLQSDPLGIGSSGGGGNGAGGDEGGEGKRKKRRGGKGKSAGQDLYKIINMIMVKGYAPVIVFAFSKKECESNAIAMTKLDFCDADEKKLIGQIFRNAIDSLSEEDRKLPAVENILPLLKRGIGIHHGGLLPILKEVIEILFQEGLVKCLFATETFAMGLNMPARTVVFSAVSKWDGSKIREISSGEYTQMAGRAGRRGLDDRGIVIVVADGDLEPPAVREMITGKADRLTSAFHLGFNMLLNLLRVDGADPEFMMSRSFHQFQATRAVPQLQEQIEKLRAEQKPLEKAAEGRAGLVSDWKNLGQRRAALRSKLRALVTLPSRAQQFLNPGRLVRVVDGDTDWGWGAVVNFQTKYPGRRHSSPSLDPDTGVVVVDVLLRVQASNKRKAPGSADEVAAGQADTGLAVYKPAPVVLAKEQPPKKKKAKQAAEPDADSEWIVIPVLLPLLDGWSSVRVRLPQKLIGRNDRKEAGKNLEETAARFGADLPLLDPVKDMKIPEEEAGPIVERLRTTEAELEAHPLLQLEPAERQALLQNRAKWEELQARVDTIETQIQEATRDIVMGRELKSMKRVLRRLGYVNADDVIDVKGRVACEISTGNELLATELMFMGAFQELAPDQIVALCSCLICDLKSEAGSEMDEAMQKYVRQLQSSAERIAGVMEDAQMTIDRAEFLDQFQPHLIQVVQAWCRGAKFADICKLTDIFEGTIVRCMRRLEELLRQFASASRSIGNDSLAQKFLDGIALLKKDIVFAASLYL